MSLAAKNAESEAVTVTIGADLNLVEQLKCFVEQQWASIEKAKLHWRRGWH